MQTFNLLSRLKLLMIVLIIGTIIGCAESETNGPEATTQISQIVHEDEQSENEQTETLQTEGVQENYLYDINDCISSSGSKLGTSEIDGQSYPLVDLCFKSRAIELRQPVECRSISDQSFSVAVHCFESATLLLRQESGEYNFACQSSGNPQIFEACATALFRIYGSEPDFHDADELVSLKIESLQTYDLSTYSAANNKIYYAGEDATGIEIEPFNISTIPILWDTEIGTVEFPDANGNFQSCDTTSENIFLALSDLEDTYQPRYFITSCSISGDTLSINYFTYEFWGGASFFMDRVRA